ncbi:MAG TPA: hypothetical protein VEX86_05655 [Longimicrobium sp.]|nr:hypothetical protein [Longimicrobium sp.]
MDEMRFRVDVLRAHGATDGETGELLAYTENAFAAAEPLEAALPLPDEPHVAAWEGYVRAAAEEGVAPVLRRVLPQLRFPVEAGIAATDAYRAATLRGEPVSHPGGGLPLEDPDGVRLFLHATPAGRIPVIVADRRADFVALVRAITRKNEPDALPDSMGACIVGGYNNWDRVAAIRGAWEAANPGAASAGGWTAYFRGEVVPRRERYQDRFILLSTGPYSAVPAEALGMDEDEWRRKSLAVRLEHECAHYFTRRVYGSMRNSLHDELIADYQGIRAAEGRYAGGWFLRFMGVEGDTYREGGRLQNYRGTPPLSAAAFTVLQAMVRSAAANLEAIDALRPRGAAPVEETARALRALTRLSLEALASAEAVARFAAAYAPRAGGPGRAIAAFAQA